MERQRSLGEAIPSYGVHHQQLKPSDEMAMMAEPPFLADHVANQLPLLDSMHAGMLGQEKMSPFWRSPDDVERKIADTAADGVKFVD